MNKLQLYMTMSRGGVYATKLDINPDQYVSSWVCDLHDNVCQVDYPAAERSIFYMVKYIDTGFFIVVIRTIPGPTHGQHLASWIYVPYSVRITDDEIVDVVRFITEKVSLSDIKSTDVAQMQERFDRQYDEEPVSPVFAQSAGLSVAYRYYGTQYALTIDDLIGRYRFQTAYIPYAGVMFVDVRLTSDVAGQDLSASPLDTMAVLMPPMAEPTGYQPYIYGQPFDGPYYAPMSRTVDVTWRRPGSDDIVVPVQITASRLQCPTPQVEEPKAPEPIDIQVDPAPQPEPEPEPDPEPEATLVDDTPAANPDIEDDPTLWADNPTRTYVAQTADVPRRTNTYYFQLPAKKASIGSVIEFEISTPTGLNESPIDGYEPTGTIREGAAYRNHLVYTGAGSRAMLINKLIWAVGGLLVGVCLTLMCTCGRGGSSKADATPGDTAKDAKGIVAQPNPAAAPAVTDASLADAILYLDSNKAWHKDSLEKYSALTGLYDDMNNFNHSRLIEYWGPKLKDSRSFNNVSRHAGIAVDGKKKPKSPAGGTTYNKPNDPVITVQTYLNTIDP